MNWKRVLALTCTLALLASPMAYADGVTAGPTVTVAYANGVVPEPIVTRVVTATTDQPAGSPIKAEEVKPAISQEDALKIAVGAFGVPESYGKPVANFWSDIQSGTATWNFSWSPDTHPNLSAKFYLNISISANDGSILAYSWSDQFTTEPKEPQYDRTGALPLAEKWLEKLVPEAKRASLKLIDQAQVPADQLYFTWVRLVNEIPFYNNMVSIYIDPVTGNLRSFSFGWDAKLELPAKTDAISLAQAEDLWQQSIGVELVYQDFYQRVTGPEARLIYRPLQDGLMIDAVTGQVIDWSGNVWTGGSKPVPIPIPATVEPVAKPEQPLTQDEALALVRKLIGGETLGEPASSGSYERYGSKFETEERIIIWSFSWSNEEKRLYTSVGVDATHGVVIEYNSGQEWHPDEYYKDKTPIAAADARQRAIEAFVKLRPDLVGQVQLLDLPVNEKYLPADYVQREYNFNFMRVIGDQKISYPNNAINIVIDRFSGDLRNIYSNWSYKPFPSASKVISRDEALATIRTEAPLELVYVTIYPSAPVPVLSVKEPVKPSIRLVYRARDNYGGSGMLDATTGHFIDYNGRDLTELRKGITDIAEQEAKKEIETAVRQGIFDTIDGKFNPLGTVTKGELAKALVTAFDRAIMYEYMKMDSAAIPEAPSYTDVAIDHAYAPYINAAIQLGIFKPTEINSKFQPEAVVSREEAALYIVRAMGFTFIDNFDAAISSGYADHASIGAAQRNAVGMLVGLKVLAKGGEFKPQAAITRADLAKILVAAGKVQRPGGPYPYYR